MRDIELIYDADCPNVPAARAVLAQALAAAGLQAQWQEWNRADPLTPAHVRNYGSPTILIDGRDVAGSVPVSAAACRIYTDATGAMRGVPPAELIAAALKDPPVHGRTGGALTAAVVLPTIGAGLLPALSCPACWPAYATALSALGLGFIDYTPYLVPTLVVFVLLSAALLARTAMRQRRFGPLVLGVAAGMLLIGAKWLEVSDLYSYAGAALFAGAALWSTVGRTRTEVACPTCDGKPSVT